MFSLITVTLLNRVTKRCSSPQSHKQPAVTTGQVNIHRKNKSVSLRPRRPRIPASQFVVLNARIT